MNIIEFNQHEQLPQLSIVCLTFNAESFVLDLISSFFAQDLIGSCEIIIGDDASQDDTVNLLTRMLEKSPCQARLIVRDDNVGPGQNWLEAIGLAKSQIIAYVDGDDYFLSSNKLSTDMEIFKKDSKINMVFGPAFKEVNGYCNGELRNVYKDWNPEKIDAEWVLKKGGGFYPTSTVVFRRAIFNDLPDWFFNTHCTGDLPLAVAALLNHGRIGYKSSTDVVYRVHNQSQTNSERSVFNTFRINTRKKDKNCDYYKLLQGAGLINQELCKELMVKEEYIFFAKLFDVGVYKYCLKESLGTLSVKYLIRLYAKLIFVLAKNMHKSLSESFSRTNGSAF